MSEPNVTDDPRTPAAPEIDQAQVDYAMQQLQSEENFPFAVVAGLAAAVLGAAAWAGITVATEFQIGFMAIGVGILVAFAIRFAGKGMSVKFQIIGALFALLGCLAGNFFTLCWFIAQNEGVAFMELLSTVNPAAIPELMISTFSGMDLFFYAIAVYEGYRLSLRQVTPEELEARLSPSGTAPGL